MISGQLFGIILLNLIAYGYCQTTGLPPAQDHEDTIPFQCNGQNQPGGSDKPSSEDRSFIRLKGKPFNCADDISAYYEIKDCGEIDELKSFKSKCYWKNGPNRERCNEFTLQDAKADEVDKGWYGLPSKEVMAFAYVPRDRENCPSQVMYTRWDDDLSKSFIRIFSASVNENDPGYYKLKTQVDSNARRVEELMTDCGDQSHVKAFFSFNRNSGESWFYNYVGPHARKEGFEYKNFDNSKEFADYCTVYANQSISCLPLTEMGGTEENGGNGFNIKLLIRLGTSDTPEQKKFCPKIVMQLKSGASPNDGSRRLKAYVGFHKEEYNTVSEDPIVSAHSGKGWASMNPSINFMKDHIGNLQQVTVNFGSAPQNDMDVGRMGFLKDGLKTIAEPNQDTIGYHCNNQTKATTIDGPYLKIKGMPFNCEASQFVDIPLDSVDFDSYGFHGNKHGYTKNSPGSCRRTCKHIKTCKHNKGQSDCEDVYRDYEWIKNRAFILKEQGESTYSKALLWQEYKDGNGKKYHHSYVTLNNQEEFTSLAMDFALNDTSSLRLELQECGGLESYLMLRIQYGLDRCYYHTVLGNGLGKIFENETDCGKVMICKESDTSAGEGEDSYCKPIARPGHDTFVFIRIAKPKKYCPTVLIKKDDDFAYIGHYPKNTNFIHDWSFLQPSIQLTGDSFLREVEIKFDSKARTEADRARLDFLEDILKTIVE